jgi:hypothetical protein
LGREADHSSPTSAEVKKIWVYTHAFMAQCLQGQIYLLLPNVSVAVWYQLSLNRRFGKMGHNAHGKLVVGLLNNIERRISSSGDVAPCGSGLNRRFGGTYRLHLQGR